jgi:hypothetical protein
VQCHAANPKLPAPLPELRRPVIRPHTRQIRKQHPLGWQVFAFDYLKDLFSRLPAAKITQIKEFTQAAWAKAKTKEQVVAQAA